MPTLLDLRGDKPAPPERRAEPDPLDVPGRALDDSGERVLVCASCGQKVTTHSARIAVDDRHEHTFANPHGYVYHIGCFSLAVGCVPFGPESSEWAWFAGHTWQIELCATCGQHLGWLFRSSARSFHGFVLDRLTEAPHHH